MKKKIIAACSVAILILFYMNMGTVTKAYAASKLHITDQKIVKVTNHDTVQYITKMDQGKGYDHIINMMEKQGWKYQGQEGSGVFFRKNGETLIVITEMWTGKYILATIPDKNNFR